MSLERIVGETPVRRAFVSLSYDVSGKNHIKEANEYRDNELKHGRKHLNSLWLRHFQGGRDFNKMNYQIDGIPISAYAMKNIEESMVEQAGFIGNSDSNIIFDKYVEHYDVNSNSQRFIFGNEPLIKNIANTIIAGRKLLKPNMDEMIFHYFPDAIFWTSIDDVLNDPDAFIYDVVSDLNSEDAMSRGSTKGMHWKIKDKKSEKIKLSKDFAGYTVKLANPSLSDMLLDLYGPRKSVGIYNKMRQAKFVWNILKDPIIKKILGEKRHHEYKTALRRYALSKIPLVNLSSPDFYVNTKEIEDIIGVVSQKYQDSPFKIKVKLEHNQYSRMDDIDGPGDLIRAEMMFNLMEAASELYKAKSKFENKEDYKKQTLEFKDLIYPHRSKLESFKQKVMSTLVTTETTESTVELYRESSEAVGKFEYISNYHTRMNNLMKRLKFPRAYSINGDFLMENYIDKIDDYWLAVQDYVEMNLEINAKKDILPNEETRKKIEFVNIIGVNKLKQHYGKN